MLDNYCISELGTYWAYELEGDFTWKKGKCGMTDAFESPSKIPDIKTKFNDKIS